MALEEWLADASWFDNALFDATDALLKGYAMQEIIWGPPRDGEFFPLAVHWRDPALFCVNPDDYRELRLRDGSHAGQVLQPFGWICHEAKAKTGYLSTQELVRTLIWPFIFKNYSVRDFAEFLEIYGLPLWVGKYPSGASAEQKSALMRAVMDIGRRAGGIIPAGMSLEFEAAANGQSDPFMAMIAWGERAISKAILGGTLTSEAGDKGARSLGEVHNAVRKEIRNADLRQLSRTFNRDLIYPLLALNSPVPLDPRRLPRLVFDTLECEDIASFAEAIPKLATGMAIPVSWIYDKLRIPVPDGNEAVFTVSSPPAVAHTALSATLTPAALITDALDAVETALDAPGLNASADPLLAPSHYQQVATTVASTSKSNTYGWLGQFPAFREWVGSRSIQQMKIYGYAINNKTYEGTVAITRDDFEDDNLGAYSPLFQEMGRAAAAQPDELVFTALRDGNKTDCYDGKPFFDSEHPVYPKVDGSGTAKKVANQFIEKTGSGATEKEYDGGVWYLLDCSRALKPLIFQNRRSPELLALTKV